MRRICCRTLSATTARRWAATAPALSGLGVATAPAQAAEIFGVPASAIGDAVPVHLAVWASIDKIGRKRLAPLASTATAEPLFAIRAKVEANPPKSVKKDGRSLFNSTKFNTLTELVTFYEEMMFPIRQRLTQMGVLEIEAYGLRDHIKLGLNLFSQEVIDQKKKELREVEASMTKIKKEITDLTSETFSTEIFNDLANVLRIAGEQFEHARDMGVRVLDDMTQLRVPVNEETKALLKSLTFGDGPCDDSNLLFTFCEFPERGEVSISRGSLDQIADEALKTISDRHQTPLTAENAEFGTKLRIGETHPLLQRSSD